MTGDRERDDMRERETERQRDRDRVWVKIVYNIYFYISTDYQSARKDMTKLLQCVHSSQQL